MNENPLIDLSTQAGSKVDDQRPAFYTAFGSNGAPLTQYASYSEHAVVAEVLAVAIKEGFKGTGEQRMRELGWTVRPVFARPQAQPADALDAARWRMLPAFYEEYQINGMKLMRDVDAAIAAAQSMTKG